MERRTGTWIRLVCTVFGMALLVQGAPPAPAEAETDRFGALVEVVRSVLQTDRKVIVAENMELTQQEGADFWPLYNEYQAERAKVGDRLVTLIRAYARSYAYDSLSDEKAKEMLKELLDVEKAKLKLKKKYVHKFERVLPARKALRFLQMENRLDAVILLDVAREIPLAE